MSKVLEPRKATEEESEAIKRAEEILSAVGLELIGTRPKRR